jgi:fibrillarin-like pre-rRNA processing protein
MAGGYRVWDPYRSKLAALYELGGAPEITREMVVLYLGAAHGTTVSHVADYACCVYAVEFAPGPMVNLLKTAEMMENIIPILGDAANPASYSRLLERADILYQDVAQPGQAAIALANMAFLQPGAPFVIMLKTRCVRVESDPAVVCNETVQVLCDNGCTVERVLWLEPWHRDHAAIVGKAPLLRLISPGGEQ